MHPDAEGHSLYIVNHDGRDNFAYVGPAAGSNLYDYAAKCQSLGMRLLTLQNAEDDELVKHLSNKLDLYMDVPMGVTRRLDGEWRNIYTSNKATTNFVSNQDKSFGFLEFAYARYERFDFSTRNDWSVTSFAITTSNARTVCVAPQEGESTEIDFCGTGFHDCHEGASCTNGGDAGYTCECQALQFGDVEVVPVDVAGTGRSCSYSMPGHDDKTLLPIRVNNNAGSLHVFHVSSEEFALEDAITYCAELGMRLPLPKNDKENTAMRKLVISPNDTPYWVRQNFFWLGIHDSDVDNTFLNIYTANEPSYTNWDDNQPKSNPYVGFQRSDGKWAAYADKKIQAVCQAGGPVSQIDWCGSGLHNCHIEANCLPSDDETSNKNYQCACKDPEQYTGNGLGENGCVFKLASKFLINNYNVDVNINDRYVRTQIAVSVTNKNTQRNELYQFGVKLDQFEFISGLTMRMGDDGDVFIGNVHKEQEVEQIFDDAISNGSGGANQSGGANESDGAQTNKTTTLYTATDPYGLIDRLSTFKIKAGISKNI